jgi:hypothetical protein
VGFTWYGHSQSPVTKTGCVHPKKQVLGRGGMILCARVLMVVVQCCTSSTRTSSKHSSSTLQVLIQLVRMGDYTYITKRPGSREPPTCTFQKLSTPAIIILLMRISLLVSSILVVAIVVMLVLHQTRAAHKYHPQQQQRLSQTLKFENNDNRRSTTLKR